MKSFKTKLFLIIAGLMIIALSSFAFTFYKVSVDSLLEENLREMKAFAIIISEYLGKHLLSDKNDLQESIQFIWRNSKSVHSFTIFDYTTTVLASTFESDVNTRTRVEDHLQVLKDGKIKIETYKEKDGGTFAIAVAPIFSHGREREKTISGGLEIVYQLEEFDRTVSKVQKILGITLAGFLVLSIFGTIFISSLITKPLFHLRDGFTEVSKGNLNTQLSVDRKDEFGEVMNAFNKMVSDLRKSTDELKTSQEDLVRKEKLAILGQLAGGVGHELRNPLGVINNAVYFLKTVMPDADETTKEYLSIIKDEVLTSERIISDLLDFSGTKTPQTKLVAVNEMVNQSLGKCVIPENITVHVDISKTLPMIKVDPLQMGQVFHNLIINAVQAMPDGGSLEISAEKDREANALSISVTDTGHGISPEDMEKLFQPLFTTKARGIGLGLVVSKRLTEANGGKIEAESQQGKETTFTVILPVEM